MGFYHFQSLYLLDFVAFVSDCGSRQSKVFLQVGRGFDYIWCSLKLINLETKNCIFSQKRYKVFDLREASGIINISIAQKSSRGSLDTPEEQGGKKSVCAGLGGDN